MSVFPARRTARHADGGAISSVYGERREVPGIQILRAIAALAVVIHHALEESNAATGRFSPDWLTTCGASGVDIFFVISGFIMLFISFPPGKEPLAPGVFLVRRFTRIYPLYWACCLVMIAISAAGFLRHNGLTPGQYLTSWILAPDARTLIGVSWTLVYEVYFYLIFAASLVIRSRLGAAVLATAAIVLAIVGGQALPESPVRVFLTNPIALEFCIGLWLGWWFSGAKSPSNGRWAVIAAGVGFLTLAVAPLLVAHPTTAKLPGAARVVAWGLPAALVVFAFLQAPATTSRWARLLRRVGDASYALYLTHEFVMIGYARLLKIDRIAALDQRLVVPVVTVGCVLLGLAAHRWLERPLLTLTRRLMAWRGGAVLQ